MKTQKVLTTLLIILVLLAGSGYSQQSGSIWVKTNKPGSADFNDETIDKKTLSFLDSLMKRDDIVITFLGGADSLPWKGLPKNSKISVAFDQAKKLERALRLRSRYGKGEVGITDEPVRGVKVVWGPKPPDAFKLRKDIDKLQAENDSLINLLTNIEKSQEQAISALTDSLRKIISKEKLLKDERIETVFSDWEVKTGFLAWSGGKPYDLMVPSMGIALKRMYWAFEIGGGFTPWSQKDAMGERGDAILFGTIALFPRRMIEYRFGFFSGWEFLAKTDNWTMKVLGITVGPSIKWKIFEGFFGYSYGRISTLTESDQWRSGILAHLNFKFLIN